VNAVVVREGKNFKGRVLGILLGSVGKRNLRSAFEQTIKAIEARNNNARAADPGSPHVRWHDGPPGNPVRTVGPSAPTALRP
jgi:hypothetical protein